MMNELHKMQQNPHRVYKQIAVGVRAVVYAEKVQHNSHRGPLSLRLRGVKHRLTSTLHSKSLKPQLPLLDEQQRALRMPSHSALSERQYAVSSAHRIPMSFTLKAVHTTINAE